MKEFDKLDKGNIEDIIALTPTQQGILFNYLKDPESDLYFEQLSLTISGDIDTKLFDLAWNFVIQSNEMMRTVYHWENVKDPVQIVLKKFNLKPTYVNLSHSESREKEKLLQEIKITDRKNKFDLRDVPFRVTLCKIHNYQYEMIISNHHILYDGWSTGIILKEFFEIFDKLCNGIRVTPPIKTKFKGFVRWLRIQDTTTQEEYWKEYLSGFKARGEHPVMRDKRKEVAETGNHHIKLPFGMKNKLEAFVRRRNITFASLLYSVWGILLQHYNSTYNVLFDTTVSGRSAKVRDIENMVGLFINTLPVRVQSKPDEKISDLLSRMHYMLQKREIFENSSPMSINKYLYDYSNQYLFDSVIILENYPLDRVLIKENGSLTVNTFSISAFTHYDLTVIVTSFDDIEINVTYNKDLFKQDSILLLSHHFTSIFREVLEDPDKTIGHLEPLPEREIKKLLSAPCNQINIKTPMESKFQGSVADEMEEGLVLVWEEVLGKRPGLEENFFEIGGNSLELIRIYKLINERYPGKIKVNDFFANPTIRELKQVLIARSTCDAAVMTKEKKIRNISF